MARVISSRGDAVFALADMFRRHGYDGASLGTIQTETGLGRGSLYHFFPGGKEEMARAVLGEVHAWFDSEIFAPLRAPGDPARQLSQMFHAVEDYFRSRQLVCLFGAFALGGEREAFSAEIDAYFRAWVTAVAGAVRRGGVSPDMAEGLGADVVAGIQGALVVARALGDDAMLVNLMTALNERVIETLDGPFM